MTDIHTAPNRIPWPPIIYLAAIAISIALGLLYPLPWLPSGILPDILLALGWLAVAGTIALYVSAMRALKQGNTTIKPHQGADHLVTNGAFSFTRNPIYLGNTLLMIGVGLITGIVWFFVLALVAAFTTQKFAIEREEKHLMARFGKKYRDYAKRVRRWI
ncbi:isoprenylcysteine carboxylmethyltransferase family protein [Mesorhizobium sp. YR577]|uniref:methyltransferase family protein n=1 Tax=Mesorhizobium sp. YR577 TaxID=1884373 RepID=UPI0008EC4D88|nr:isoprenylcysteine carboxylmethyltransferase family protein [Mesorhizobium sp. YR577]SFU04255.1 Protein-S-isoprenylcysteine O-methyltransferase Ste14 [Mesorhizobium sp. YR577]